MYSGIVKSMVMPFAESAIELVAVLSAALEYLLCLEIS